MGFDSDQINSIFLGYGQNFFLPFVLILSQFRQEKGHQKLSFILYNSSIKVDFNFKFLSAEENNPNDFFTSCNILYIFIDRDGKKPSFVCECNW